MARKILGIIGSYRRDGVTDRLVSTVLDAAREKGAEVSKVYLLDQRIEFCTNCRNCTQQPGLKRGQCIHDDDMSQFLDQIEAADGLVLGAPVNAFNVNALTRRFMERLVCLAYWPWEGSPGPEMRLKKQTRPAVIVTSCAMPSLMARIATGAVRALKYTAKTLGAEPSRVVVAGMIARRQRPVIPNRTLRKARHAGHALADQ